MDKEDKEGGLLKRLKNIENAQKKLDKSEYDEDEDEKKKLSVILIKVVLRVWKVLNYLVKQKVKMKNLKCN